MTTVLKTLHVCQACGFGSPKWLGRCPGCGEWGTLVEEIPPANSPRGGIRGNGAIAFKDISESSFERISTGSTELDRALGGGIVPGSLVLLGGEPGIGKSTLLLQVANSLARSGQKVLYAAGEESPQQIKLRGERLGVEGHNLFLAAETELERVLEEARRIKPQILVVDSIQTAHTGRLDTVPGSLGQVRECAGQLLSFAKTENVSVFLIGHITKDGMIAGPKTLEHVVDVVLYFEGERHQNHKIIRAVKNRFGPANELGIFEMTGAGLMSVESPSRAFLSERPSQEPGSAVLCTVEGSRPVLVEIQALVSRSNYSTARRMANGVDPNRVSLLLAMLEKRLGLKLIGTDVYVNVAGGLTLTEPAVDLAIVAAILSSFRDRPIPSGAVLFGELGLAGEVRGVSFAHARVKEAQALGFQKALMPQSNLPLSEAVKGITLVPIGSISSYLKEIDRFDEARQ